MPIPATRAELNASTQVQYPWKATLRTLVQVGIPTLLTLLVVVPAVIEVVLDELGEAIPENLRLWLLGASAVIVSVSAAISRIMAIPAVNLWLAKFGLGTVPQAPAE